VTAESFRTAIERDISPKFSPDYLDPRWKVLVGAEAYNAGKSAHVSGISAHGITLVLHLTQPVPDLPTNLALNVFCAVPPGTPIVPHGLEASIPSAGPLPGALTDSVALEAKPELRRFAVASPGCDCPRAGGGTEGRGRPSR
jgi:hypothetical protein